MDTLFVIYFRVFGEVDSKAAVHMEDGVMTAKIVTPEDTYHVEPSWRHFADGENDDKRSMIAYKESDVLYSWNQPNADDFVPPKVCDYVKENGTYDGEDDEDEYDEHGHRDKIQ